MGSENEIVEPFVDIGVEAENSVENTIEVVPTIILDSENIIGEYTEEPLVGNDSKEGTLVVVTTGSDSYLRVEATGEYVQAFRAWNRW